MEHEFIGAIVLAVVIAALSVCIFILMAKVREQEVAIGFKEQAVSSLQEWNKHLGERIGVSESEIMKLHAENKTLQAENRKLSSEKMRLAEERIRSEKQKNEMLRMIDKRQASLSQYKKLLFLSMSGKEIPSEYLGKIMEME